MASEISIINTFLNTTLGTDANLIAAIPRDDDAAKARVFYSGAIDQQTTRPLIRWNIASVTAQKVMGGTTKFSTCVVDVTVEGAKDSTLEDITTLDERIKTLLDNVVGSALTGTIFESVWEQSMPLIIYDEGLQYAQITNRFRLREQ
jgi:hypothetical protein